MPRRWLAVAIIVRRALSALLAAEFITNAIAANGGIASGGIQNNPWMPIVFTIGRACTRPRPPPTACKPEIAPDRAGTFALGDARRE